MHVLVEPSPAHAGAGGLRRWAGGALVVLSLTTLFVLVPAPRWAVAEELGVRSEHVRLSRKLVDRSAEPVATAGVDAAEVAERRGALGSRDRRTSGVRRTEVRAIGVTLPTAPADPVLVRARVDGTWSPWLEIPFADGEAPDLSTPTAPGVHSEPVWLGEADAYELDGPSDLATLEVHAVEPTGTRRTSLPAGAAGAAGAPAIRSRASWGARPPSHTPSKTADLKLAIVHHTVSGNTYSASQVPAVLRSIQAYHQDVRGYGDIAYNILVDRFGVAWEGRAGGLRNVVLGGHSQGFNTGSVGVSVIGDYRFAGVSTAVFETVARVIAWKLAIHGVDPRSTVPYTSAGSAKYGAGTTVTLPRVVGHRDVQATNCPGGNLYARLGALRSRVTALVPTYQAGLPPTLVAPDLTGDGLVDPLEYRAGTGGDQIWRATASGSFSKSLVTLNGTVRPVVGDFDGNGYDEVLFHGAGSAADSILWGGPGGSTSQGLTVQGSYVPVVGDFDGNGVDDVFWYNPGLGQDSVWYFDRSRGRRHLAVREDLITGVPLVGDYDGDGRDDVLFYGPGSASDRLWWSQGSSWAVQATAVHGHHLPAAFDATGDGRDDITWLAPGATASARWTFTPARALVRQTFQHGPLSGAPIVGDFDDDGLVDLLSVAPGAARDAVWYSTPVGIVERQVTLTGTYAAVAGPMDRPLLLGPGPDDVLFVSNGPDHVWRGQTSRSFSSTQVG